MSRGDTNCPNPRLFLGWNRSALLGDIETGWHHFFGFFSCRIMKRDDFAKVAALLLFRGVPVVP
jgi:hypothetical protein